MQFHLLSFEGPDAYSRVGGLATRIDGLVQTLDTFGFETHLWFVGDPDLSGYEVHGAVHLHRWGQCLSRQHPYGVYDGETEKTSDYARSLPPHLLDEVAMPHIRAGGRIVVLAEEWQTVDALLHLDWLLRRSGEDYAIPGQNALVLETEDPHEFLSLFQELRSQPGELRSIRSAGRSTARRYTWPRIVRRVVLPRIDALPVAW